MIDYTAIKIAQMEHEETIRSLAPVYDYDEWLTHKAGHWQAPSIGSVLSSLAQHLVLVGSARKQQAQFMLPVPQTQQESSGVTS